MAASGELCPGRRCVWFLGTHSARELRYEERDQDNPYRQKCDPELLAAYWFGLGTKVVKQDVPHFSIGWRVTRPRCSATPCAWPSGLSPGVTESYSRE